MKRNVLILCIALWSLLMTAETAMAQTQTITVGRGETFALIAKRYGMTVDELKQMNPSAIDGVVGMKLQVKVSPVSATTSSATTTATTKSTSTTNKASSKTAKKDSAKKTSQNNEYESMDKIMEQVRLCGKAEEYIESQKYGKAIQIYDQLIRKYPSGEWYALKGFCLSKEEKYKAAIKQYEAALAMNDMDDKSIRECKENLEITRRLQQEKVERRKRTWANIGVAVAVGAAVAGTAYAASQSSSQSSYTNTAYMPSAYTYSNATSQFGSRSDQILANAERTAHQIGQNTMAQSQQMAQRAQQASREQMNWAANFRRTNGREPTELEQDNWLRTHYPDIWQMKIQAAANAESSSSSSKSSSSSSNKESLKEKNHEYWVDKAKGKECGICKGSGKCQTCNGTGIAVSISRGKYPCPVCFNHDGKCIHCNGRGINH